MKRQGAITGKAPISCLDCGVRVPIRAPFDDSAHGGQRGLSFRLRWMDRASPEDDCRYWYFSIMPIYIESLGDAGGIMTSYYLLDNIEHFAVHRSGKQSSITANLPSDRTVNRVKLVQNVDEKTAVDAIQELLSLTGGTDNETTIVIKWNGQRFTRRFVQPLTMA
jgi:hypothetical protein